MQTGGLSHPPKTQSRKKDAAGACFSKGPQTFRSQRQILKSTPVELEAQFLAHNPVNYASLTDSFIVLFSKLLKL